MKNFWHNRVSWQKGFLIGVLIVLVYLLYLLARVGFGYDGKCGGQWSFLSGGSDCPFAAYLFKTYIFILSFWLYEFWWVLIGLPIAGAIVGYIAGKAKRH